MGLDRESDQGQYIHNKDSNSCRIVMGCKGPGQNEGGTVDMDMDMDEDSEHWSWAMCLWTRTKQQKKTRARARYCCYPCLCRIAKSRLAKPCGGPKRHMLIRERVCHGYVLSKTKSERRRAVVAGRPSNTAFESRGGRSGHGVLNRKQTTPLVDCAF